MKGNSVQAQRSNGGDKLDAFVGLDVGGTQIKALALSPLGELLVEKSAATKDDGTRSWMEWARDLFREVVKDVSGEYVVGVASPGLAARDGDSIAFMPGRLAGLEGLNWGVWLGVKTRVPVFNDAQAALLGEASVGAAKGVKNVALLTLGTGVGGAAMVDGHLLRGHLCRAGHLGHVSLDPDGALDIVNTPGSLEDAIGESTLVVRSGGRFKSTRKLVEAFRKGSKEAEVVWLKSVRALSAAIAGFINVLDPEVIVIGGGIADAEDALFKPLEAELDKFEWRPGGARVRIVKGSLGQRAGAIGAAYGAKLASEQALGSYFSGGRV